MISARMHWLHNCSSFMLGRALTSVFWGKVADLYGRRPVIIIGTSTIVIFNTLFGLSINYWMAVTMRKHCITMIHARFQVTTQSDVWRSVHPLSLMPQFVHMKRQN
ncbi:hypothetical protein DCAR_0935785 [Daucus carota subsp. sativus]|uniref:Major facilitator superfamily (MFS) profile domain-containing protein n=1 Tax=Daucus carota subsp. sativus TaxID=79200 RepID=A0AAF1BEA0_DAUCS|nr:hypothetical protein DCAR_0935785 [Daucus carota subsp. sativus]